MLPKIFRRLFQNEGYGKLLNKEIIPTDISTTTTDALEVWRKSLIGGLFYLPATTLPAGYGVADGSLFLFEDYPELGEKYEAGVFSGLLLNYDASDEDKNAYPGKWIPDAANPAGLYAPRLTDLFIQNSGTSDAGKFVAAGLPAVGDKIRLQNGAGNGEYGKNQFITDNGTAGSYVTMTTAVTITGGLYGLSDTVQPPTVKLAPAIYLGKPA